VPVAVLDEVEVLDQEIAPARPVGQERLHLVERLRIDLAALRGPAGAAAAFRRLGNCIGI
jgi:hypothetical protein